MCLAESSLCYDELLNLPNSCLLTCKSFEYLCLKIPKLGLIDKEHGLTWVSGVRKLEVTG